MSATYQKSNPSARERHITPQDDRRLAEFSLYALRETQPSRLIDRAVTLTAEGLQVDFCTLLAWEPDGEALRVVASHGWPDSRLNRLMALAECTQCKLALERYSASGTKPFDLPQPVVIENLRHDQTTKDTFQLRELGVVSSLCVVLPGAERPYGTLVVHSRKERTFDAGECEFLGSLVNLLAAALERCQAHAALQKSEERFRGLVRVSSDWYWEQDADLRFTFASDGFFERTGIPRADVIGKYRWDLAVGSPLVSSWEAHRAALEAHLPFSNFELWRFATDGTRQYHCVSGEPVFDEEGRFAGYRGTTRDITTQKLAEQTQREQRRLLARAQELGGLGYWEYEASTGLMTGSRELRSMLEIPDGLPGQTLEWSFGLVGAQDRERVRSEVRLAIKQGSSFRIEAHVTAIEGKQRIMVIAGEGMKDSAGIVSKVIGSCVDITERRHREQALLGATDELQSLSRRLVEAQETERRRLAVELHDQVGQNLTALCINFDILARRMNSLDTDSVRRLQDSINLLEATAQRIEGVLDDLRPPMLDDWGIGPTAQWVAEAFSTRTDIPVHVQMLGVERRFDRQKELALVRVLQEALNNVAKHAHAEIVDVLLRWRVSSVHVEIVDNGIGFEHDRSGARRGLGLLSMRERMQAAHGLLEIESVPGKGTRVCAWVPG